MAIDSVNNFMQKYPIAETYEKGKFGAYTFPQPQIQPSVKVQNPYGIAIPENKGGRTVAEDGITSISTGQDGYGLAHRNKNEFNFMAIA